VLDASAHMRADQPHPKYQRPGIFQGRAKVHAWQQDSFWRSRSGRLCVQRACPVKTSVKESVARHQQTLP
jgi:hypothetical protein